MVKPFVMDGIEYNVSVEALERSFTIAEATRAKTALNGEKYRDIVGTYYNYTMVVSERNGDREALDAFFDAISNPVDSHICVFPYGQNTLTQRMYVMAGTQPIRKITSGHTEWQSMTVAFYAKAPKVMP